MNRKENKLNIGNFIYGTLLITQMVFLISLVLEIRSLEQICSYAIMGIGLCFCLVNIFHFDKRTVADYMFLILISVLFIEFLLVKNYSKVLPILIGYILMISVLKENHCIISTPFMKNFLWSIELVKGIGLICLSLTSYAYKFFYVEETLVEEGLTLGFSNPNQTAIIIVYTTISLFVLARSSNNRYAKFISYLVVCWLGYLLIQTNARISLIALILFVLWDLFILPRKNEYYLTKKRKMFIILMVLLPIIFLLIYMYMYKNGILLDFKMFHKSFYSGRQEIYEKALNNFDNKLLGDMEKLFSNFHNSGLTIMVNTGVLGLALYYLCSVSQLFHLFRLNVVGKKTFRAFYAILITFFIGCAESAMAVSGNMYYVMFLNSCVLLSFLNSEEKYERSLYQ